MSITIGGWILVGFIFIIGIIFSVMRFIDKEPGVGIVFIIATLIVTLGVMFFMNWYNTNTASGARSYNTYKSEMSNGIERTIDIYNAEGELRYHFEGTVDIDDESQAYTLFFDTQDGQRMIVHYGVQDLVVIQSK